MEANINALPDLVLRNIFSKLDSVDVINLAFICTLWREYQLAITSKMDSLIIVFGSDDPLDSISKSLFTIPHLEEVLDEANRPMHTPQSGTKKSRLSYLSSPSHAVRDQIISAYPLLTKLQIVIDNIKFSEVADFFVEVMQSWSEKLTTLEVYYRSKEIRELANSEDFDYCAEVESSQAIMSMISFCYSLKHLTVDCDTYFFRKKPKRIFDLIGDLPPNLSTLKFKSLDFIEGRHLEILYEYLKDNDQLEQFALLNRTSEAMDSPKWLRFSSKWTTKPANVRYWNESKFSTFPSLTSVDINYHCGLDLVKLLNSLSPLKELIYLRFTLGLKEDVAASHLEFSKYESFYCSEINPLTAVKVLKLKLLNLQYHFDVQSTIWSRAFPEVQVIIIKHKCVKYCQHYRNMQIKAEYMDDNQITESIRKMIKTFKQCPKLRCIYTNYPAIRRWEVSELK